MAKTLKQCKQTPEFVKYAKKKNAQVDQGKEHIIVRTEKGICALPRHTGDLKTGTRFSIIKTFIAIGLAVILLTVVATML